MHRMNLKVGVVLLSYSLLITAFFLAGIVLFQSWLARSIATAPNSAAYILSGQETVQTYATGSTVISANQLTNTSSIGNYYTQQELSHLMLIAILFCLILIVSTALLWALLRHMQESDALRIARKLQTIMDDGQLIKVAPAISAAYDDIRATFQSHLNDYKRLNSYLSHEQKNAIAILRANLEISENEDCIRSLDGITDSIDDILTLSDTDIDAAKSTVDVAFTCARVCDTYRKLTDKIKFAFSDDDDTTVQAKERWIYRAICNLLDNAVKYGEGKTIEVTVENRHHSVIVTVRDHGIGMEKEQLGKIFGNRYRINNLNRDGYGIGLSLVSYVCDLCGGYVWVDSVKNEGSIFILSFPEFHPGR